jgi:hypothetical protein
MVDVTCLECERPICARRLCAKHYNQKLRRGLLDQFATKRRTVTARYSEKVDRTDARGCHPWTGSLDKNGYGYFRVNDRMVKAHRWAYENFIGTLNPREVVRHTCDNPRCQNPRHLLKGSVRDNVHDMISRGRTGDFAGVSNGKAKISERDVLNIRKSTRDPKALAVAYNMTVTNIRAIQKRLTWKHVP